MRPFKFLKDNKVGLSGMVFYLLDFCTNNHDQLEQVYLNGIQISEYGDFFLTEHTWDDNDTTRVKFRCFLPNGDIYTIKLIRSYNWHTHQYFDYTVEDNGIRHNNQL